jgi:hypothetical protein
MSLSQAIVDAYVYSHKVVVDYAADFIANSGLNIMDLNELKTLCLEPEFKKNGVVVSLKADKTVAYIGVLNNRIKTKIVITGVWNTEYSTINEILNITKELMFATTVYINALGYLNLLIHIDLYKQYNKLCLWNLANTDILPYMSVNLVKEVYWVDIKKKFAINIFMDDALSVRPIRYSGTGPLEPLYVIRKKRYLTDDVPLESVKRQRI